MPNPLTTELKALAEYLAKDAWQPVSQDARASALRGIRRTERQIAETGVPPGMRVMGENVPFPGSREAQLEASVTRAQEPSSWVDGARSLKNFMGGFFDSAPGVSKSMKNLTHDAHIRQSLADTDATNTVLDALSPIKEDHQNKFLKLTQYMKLADRIATVRGQMAAGARTPGEPASAFGASLKQLEDAYNALGEQLTPDVMKAHANVRKVLDDVFDDMVNNGYISKDRYRSDYLPMQKLDMIVEGMSMRGRNTVGGRVLPSMLQRGPNNEIVESNMLPLLKDHLADYYSKRAEDEFLKKVVNDPSVNVTQFFRPGQYLPKGFVVYRSGPGLPGWGVRDESMKVFEGAKDAILGGPLAKGQYQGIGIVVPEEVGRVLASFKSHSLDPTTQTLANLGGKWARTMTVYNPRNTSLNMVSDLLLGLLGMPGEKAQALGMLRFEPRAIRVAFKGSFGKGRELVTVGGKTFDPYDLAMRQGLGSSTLTSDIGGLPIDAEMLKFAEPMTMKPWEKVADFMKRTRNAVEMSPRIAAGLEALARTGDINEFGRVGRDITLPYGHGAPLHARNPYIRFLTPFIQFTGLASKRIFDLVKAPESRGRTLLAMAVVPTTIWMWNNQNDDFKKVERSLKPYERDQLHIVFPDPSDPSKPMLDRTGKPIVMRVRYFVPEEIMKTYGLGNLPGKISRAMEGRQTIGETAKEAARSAGESAAFQFGPISTAQEILTGRSTLTGQERKGFWDAMSSLTPQTRSLAEIAKSARSGEGIADMTKTAIEQTLGMGFANVERKGRFLMDADIREVDRKLRETRAELNAAINRKDRVLAQDLRAKLVDLRKRRMGLRKAQVSG